MTAEAERTHTSAQVGNALTLKAGMVRRYQMALESVVDKPLPRDPQTNGRLVNDEQLAVLRQARDLVRSNPSLSVEDAVRSILGVYTGPTAPAIPREEMLEAIILELRGLRREVGEQRSEIAALREENTALQEQMRALPEHSPSSDTQAEKMNAYLLGELERRRLEAEAAEKPRPWWRPWSRR